MGGIREDDVNSFVTLAGTGNKKLEPFRGEKRHVAAEDEVPFDGAIGGGGMLQRGDNASEGAFAGPAIFNDFEFCAEAEVFLGLAYNGHIVGEDLERIYDPQKERRVAESNQSFVATEPRTSAASENIPAHARFKVWSQNWLYASRVMINGKASEREVFDRFGASSPLRPQAAD